MEQQKAFYLLISMIFYFCFIGGSLFLLIKGRELLEYNVSAGAVPFITILSLVSAIFYTYRYKQS